MQAMNIPILSSQSVETAVMNFDAAPVQNEKSGSSFLEMLTSLNSTQMTQNEISPKETSTSPETKSFEKTPEQEKPYEKTKDSQAAEKTEDKKELSEKKSEEEKKVNSDVQDAAVSGMNKIPEKSVLKNNTKVAEKTDSESIEGLSKNQLEYLKITKSDDPEDIIANATVYKKENLSRKNLLAAQDLSIEEPQLFLNKADVTNENIAAADFAKKTLSALKEDSKNNTKVSLKKSVTEEKNKIQIIDNRGSLSKEEAAKSVKDRMKLTVSAQDDNTVNMTLTMAENAEQNILSLNSQAAGAQGSNFQAMLSEQIQQNAPEFVKAGNIVLQDNKTGSINLILKPENLGNVKVSLQLSDKVITGQIIVNSQEAYDAFKENIETLKQAFQQSGFESPAFNLSFANNGSNFEGQNSNQNNFAQSFNADRVYGDYAITESSGSHEVFAEYKTDSSYAIDYIA